MVNNIIINVHRHFISNTIITTGQLHILCSVTGDCIRESSPLDTSLSSFEKPNIQHNIRIHNRSIGVRKADVPTEENLLTESQKLQDEISVVQDVETAMENEIEKLDERRPSKAVRTEESELKNELAVMKDIESDLVSKDTATEEELEKIESTDTETDEDTYEADDEDYSEQEEETDRETLDSDYEYTDDYTNTDEDDYRQRRGVDHFRPRKPHHRESFRVDYVKHEPKHPHTHVAQESAIDQENSKISEDVNRAEKLSDTAQKLQEEVNVVQDVESVMEDELKSLKKHHPSKVTNAEVKEIKNGLTVMKELESDLVTKEEATEHELEEVENEIENESDQSHDTEVNDQYEDYDQEQSEYTDIDDYSYEEGQSMDEDREKRALHFKPHNSKVTQRTVVGVVKLHPIAHKHLNFYKNKGFHNRRPNFLHIRGLQFGKHLDNVMKQHKHNKRPPLHSSKDDKVVDALLHTLTHGSTVKNGVKNLEEKVLQLATKAKTRGLSTQEEAKLKAEIRSLVAEEKKIIQELRNFGLKKRYT